MKNVRLSFEFENRQQIALDVWLALPPHLPGQPEVDLTWTHRQPDCLHQVNQVDQVDDVATGETGNVTAFATLQPGDKIGFAAVVGLMQNHDPKQSDSADLLTAHEREWYLRSSNLIQINPDVRQLAEQLVHGAATDEEKAKRLYLYIVQSYTYRWPPLGRGSEAGRIICEGDCGEYSHVYAALCRSIGLPCRVLYGTWAFGEGEAHAWNEVYISNTGWVVVDTSGDQSSLMGMLVKRSLAPANLLLWRWGQPRADRVAFSIDPDILLVPPFLPVLSGWPVEGNGIAVERMLIAGRDFAWGLESLEGRAPYLQPIYIRQHQFENWSKDQEPLGRWRVSDMPNQAGNRLAVREGIIFLIAVALVFVSVAFGISQWIGFAGLALIGLMLLMGSSQAKTIARVLLVTAVMASLIRRLLS